MSPDHDFQADRLAANAWAVGRYRAGALAQPMTVTRPERELEDWCAAEPLAVLKAVVAAAWPNDPQAARPSIEARLSIVLDNMTKVDYLQPTARFCKQLYADHREPSRLIEEVRANLPTRARAADARHPANPDNRARNRARPDDSVRNAIDLPRWRLYVTERVFRIEENQSGSDYTMVDQIPANDRARIIKTLIELNIEVKGTPAHGGSHGQGSGGFSVAMNGLIDEELVKARAITR